MYDALGTLYQNVNICSKILLRHKITTNCMCRTDTIASYVMKPATQRDQLGAVDDKVKENELVRIALNGFTASWHNFVQGYCTERSKVLYSPVWGRCCHIL